MNKWRWTIAGLSIALSLAQTPGWAAPTMTLTPTQGPAGTVVQVNVCGLPISLSDPRGFRIPLSTVTDILVQRPGGATTVVAQSVPLVPCGTDGLGFGTGTGRPPASIQISGIPETVVITTRRGDIISGPTPQATFTITAGTPPAPQPSTMPNTGTPTQPSTGSSPAPGSLSTPSPGSSLPLSSNPWLDPNGVLFACVNSSGQLRVIPPTVFCASNEFRLRWLAVPDGLSR